MTKKKYNANKQMSKWINEMPPLQDSKTTTCSNCGFEYDKSEIEKYKKDGQEFTICNDCKEADNDWQ